jgi:Asparagine synthase
MCDFIVSLDKRYGGKDLLNLIKKPYDSRAPEGEYFDYSWGSMAVLKERLADDRNILMQGGTTFAWVGDLVIASRDSFLETFINRLVDMKEHGKDVSASIKTDELFGKLNGAFAIILANASGFSIVTDPVNFIPVYVGKNNRDELVSFGTHPDLVSIISGDSLKLDVVSAAEFLNSGNSTFPNTMHTNVKEMKPGRVHNIKFSANNKVAIKNFLYWSPPKEITEGYDEKELAEELRNAIIRAVRDRCNGKKTAILLSGGLDSRAIMAVVPEDINCIGLTFCNELNREARTARKVAQCYGRDWVMLTRKREFLGNRLVSIVKFAGCEFEWLNAHTAGFVNEISQHGIGSLLSGIMFDSYFKGYCVPEFVEIRRMWGLLPGKYVKRPFDYSNNLTEFWKCNLRGHLIDDIYNRRKQYIKKEMDASRSSVEYLMSCVFSQGDATAYWVADRRVLPIRLVAADKGLLDFAFKCPVEAKLGGRIFLQAAINIYGAGAKIPNANNGVRPFSSHLSRLLQRAVRKLQNNGTKVLEKLGRKHKCQESWYDYQGEWNRSSLLEHLRNQYAANLDEFDGVIFKGRGRDLLYNRNIPCIDSYRILQLAVWRGIIREYRENK